jgi:glutathione synthase/RimK-type ligase-like ATP-grasp enzyme
MRVVLSTCVEHPKLYSSDELLAKALEQRGHTVSAVPWNGPEPDDENYANVDAVVLRANWDYHENPQAFLAWLDRLDERGVRVLNDTALVRWNFDKRYLLELQEKLGGRGSDEEANGQGGAAGRRLRIPEVHVVDHHDPDGIVALMALLGWEEAVLKSLSGQSGYHCERIRRDNKEAWEAAALAIPTEAALLQAFQPEISTLNETVFVFISGEFSHATRRVVADGEWRANSRFGAVKEAVVSPSALLVEQARRVLQAAPISVPPLYARVDGIADGDSLILMELELIEPALYLETDAQAAHRLADALEKAVLMGDVKPGGGPRAM